MSRSGAASDSSADVADTVTLPLAVATLAVLVTAIVVVLCCTWCKRRRNANELQQAVQSAREERQRDAVSGGASTAALQPWESNETQEESRWKKLFRKQKTREGGDADELKKRTAQRALRRRERERLRRQQAKLPHWWRAPVGSTSSSESDDAPPPEASQGPWAGLERRAKLFTTVGTYQSTPLDVEKEFLAKAHAREARKKERRRWLSRLRFWKTASESSESEDRVQRLGAFPSPAAPSGAPAGRSTEAPKRQVSPPQGFRALHVPSKAGSALQVLGANSQRKRNAHIADDLMEAFNRVAPFNEGDLGYSRPRHVFASSRPLRPVLDDTLGTSPSFVLPVPGNEGAHLPRSPSDDDPDL